MEMLPITFSSFIGQEQIKIKLQVQIDATKKRRVPLDNFLLCGPDQMGKLTLAKTIAGEMGVTIRVLDSEVVSAKNTPILKLQEVLTHVRAGDLLVLERIDALKANSPAFSIFRDYLSANAIDVEVGKGDGKKKVKLNLPKISIIGLSAYPRRIDSKLREYFAIQYDLLPYTVAEISELIVTFVEELKQSIDVSAAQLIAAYCDGNPGKAKILSKRVADFALTKSENRYIEVPIAKAALEHLDLKKRSNSTSDLRESLIKMTGIEFESYMSDFFRERGFIVEVTRTSGDHGIDLFLKKANEIIAVQCKRWFKPVGEPVLRDFYGALMSAGCKKGIVVTTTNFTAQAISFCKDKPINLVDLDVLIETIARYRDDR